MMQDTWMDRLSEYLDEELDRPEREALESHLSGCDGCASVLAELRSVRDRARTGLDDSPVPAAVWPRIEAGIAATRARPAGVVKLETPQAREGGRRTRFSFSLPELIAASVAIAILSGGAVFALMRHQEAGVPPRGTTMTRAPESSAPVRAAAPSPIESSGSGVAPASATIPASTPPLRTGGATLAATGESGSPHEEAIAELRKALARQRDRLDPATIRTLESNLAIIDLAIDQGKRALAADPANTYVKEHLAETMRRKVELLQRATMLAANSEESR